MLHVVFADEQSRAGPGSHDPDVHTSASVQKRPSSHGKPSETGAATQPSVSSSHHDVLH